MTTRVGILAMTCMLCGLGCGEDSARCMGSAIEGLYGASTDAPFEFALAASVVRVETARGRASDELCTGVLVSERRVLTAAHCARGASPAAVSVVFGSEPEPAERDCATLPANVHATSLTRHASLDLMLIDLDQAVDGAIAAPHLKQGFQLEASAVIAAYGLTERGQMRALRFLATTLQQIDPATTTITVNSGPTAGACGGDSGGPLFVATQDDGWRLAGILSVGSAYCLGEDTFIDVTQLSEWIDS